jgi:dihydrofolate reductase
VIPGKDASLPFPGCSFVFTIFLIFIGRILSSTHPNMNVIALVLTDQQNVIGKNHVVLQYLPAYQKYFDRLTKNHPIIMGRRTFEAIAHTLEGKRKIIVTKSEKYHSVRARTYGAIHDALEACHKDKKVFVIGGSRVFTQSLPYTTEIYRTCVKARFRSDDYFPEIDTSEFELDAAECINADRENRFDYCIERWKRIGKPKKFI